MNKKELLNKADELIKKADEIKKLANQEEILVPDEIKISYEHWYLSIHNWNQKLYYNKTYWDWCVSNAIWDETIKCKLTPCEYEELENWDLFFRSLLEETKPYSQCLFYYAIKINNWNYQYWDGQDCRNSGVPWKYYWKVEPLNFNK